MMFPFETHIDHANRRDNVSTIIAGWTGTERSLCDSIKSMSVSVLQHKYIQTLGTWRGMEWCECEVHIVATKKGN